MIELEPAYLSYRPLLLSLAYRMLGSVMDAEDLVQDTFVTLQQKPMITHEGTVIHNLKAYLCKMVTNRCIDYLKSARKTREQYVGPWLPEPVVHASPADTALSGALPATNPLQTIELEDTISYALMMLMEQLTPIERAVFILRESFDYSYHEIAEIVGRTESSCRQIYSRLKRKIQAEPGDSTFIVTQPERVQQLIQHFLHAAATGNMQALVQLLSDDITIYSDGGGKVLAAIRPITTIQHAAAFILGLTSKYSQTTEVRPILVNGQIGLISQSADEPYPTIMSLEIDHELKIKRIYLVRNPDKLRHINL